MGFQDSVWMEFDQIGWVLDVLSLGDIWGWLDSG